MLEQSRLSPFAFVMDRKSDLSCFIDAAVKGMRERVLTQREAQILSMMLKGYSNLSIASMLNISEGTVKIHRRNSYRKLEISSQIELFLMVLNSALNGERREFRS